MDLVRKNRSVISAAEGEDDNEKLPVQKCSFNPGGSVFLSNTCDLHKRRYDLIRRRRSQLWFIELYFYQNV